MKDGALLSVVSLMANDLCCPVFSEAGRTSSMPPACIARLHVFVGPRGRACNGKGALFTDVWTL